jgi:hypothetical protein
VRKKVAPVVVEGVTPPVTPVNAPAHHVFVVLVSEPD